MLKNSIKVLVISTAFFIFGNISGCSAPASKEAIIVDNITISKHHEKTVSIATNGGSETTAMDSTNVSDEALKEAITESIARNKLFQKVIQGKQADYQLTVNIINISKPVFGLTFTVQMEATWSLVNLKDNSIVMREVINSSHTTSFSEAFAAVTRLKLAVEGAVKENIQLGLTKVAKLQLN